MTAVRAGWKKTPGPAGVLEKEGRDRYIIRIVSLLALIRDSGRRRVSGGQQ